MRTAAHEFAQAGFEQASLNTIIKQCRMSKSSFYHFFDSKLALYEFVLAVTSGRLRDELVLPEPQTFDSDDFWGRVLDLVARLTEVLTSENVYVDLGRMLYDRQAPNESVVIQRILASAGNWIHAVVLAGRASGEIGADLPASLQGELAFTVLRAIDDWSIRHHDEFSADQIHSVVNAQIAALRRLLKG